MNYDATDLSFGFDGDFTIGQDGDLGDTSSDAIIALRQEVQSIVKSEFGDWKAHPTFAANLSEYIGEPNTRTIGKAIEERVKSSIISHGVVKAEDLDVRVLPVHIHQMLILIKIMAMATPDNSLVLGQPIVTALIYDSVESSIWHVNENLIEKNYGGT